MKKFLYLCLIILIVSVLIFVISKLVEEKKYNDKYSPNDYKYQSLSQITDEIIEYGKVGLKELKSSDESVYKITYSKNSGILLTYDNIAGGYTRTRIYCYNDVNNVEENNKSIDDWKIDMNLNEDYEFHEERKINGIDVVIYVNNKVNSTDYKRFEIAFVMDNTLFIMEHTVNEQYGKLPEGFQINVIKEIIENFYTVY